MRQKQLGCSTLGDHRRRPGGDLGRRPARVEGTGSLEGCLGVQTTAGVAR